MRADAAANRTRLLVATFEAVSADGTSVPAHEIAERAGVSPATLYRHFPDRATLLAQCSVWGWGRIDGMVRRRLASAPSAAAVRDVLRDVVGLMLEGDRYLEATGERVGRTPVEILRPKAIAEERFGRLVGRAERAGELVPGIDAPSLLELTMTIRQEARASERLDLLLRGVVAAPDGR